MRKLLLATLLASCICNTQPIDESQPKQAPQLLLSTKLLRRLKRDRERQTVRWVNFENRVRTVPDSSERGFELALYVAITGNEEVAREAVQWATAHPCEYRQRALIEDWVGALAPAACTSRASSGDLSLRDQSLRDRALQRIIDGQDTSAISAEASRLVSDFAQRSPDAQRLYELVELLTVLRGVSGKDLRNTDPQFFRSLPTEFLLSLKPADVEHPSWIAHIAALALVSVDPNLEASQFLQGWALEDRQTLRDGPGVAYELLWADPYLPGIAYQNLDPWSYDEETGRLFARSDWTPDACWISIFETGLQMSVQEMNCPEGWRNRAVHFGTLTLIPMSGKCLQLNRQDQRQNLIIWKLTPGQRLVFGDKGEKKGSSAQADGSGLWHPGANVEGKVCLR